MSGSRFTIGRWGRIVGGTAVVMAWATAGVARGAALAPPTESAEAAPAFEPLVAEAAVEAPLPTLPRSGLVVVRVAPEPDAPAPAPAVSARRRVTRVVVQAPAAPAPRAAAPQPTTTRSSGS